MPYKGGFPRVSEGLKGVRGRYEFAVDGGAIGSIVITSEKIPAGAYVLGGFAEVDTAVVGAGASVAIQLEAANDVITAAAVSGAPWSTTGRKSVIPVFTGATSLLTTAARDISFVISAAVLTAGVVDVVLFYVVMGD